jgi:hypothetical protein
MYYIRTSVLGNFATGKKETYPMLRCAIVHNERLFEASHREKMRCIKARGKYSLANKAVHV